MFSGRIACANVVSDVFAMGVTEIDNMLMILAVSTQMTDKERDVTTTLMIEGFKVRSINNLLSDYSKEVMPY